VKIFFSQFHTGISVDGGILAKLKHIVIAVHPDLRNNRIAL
jgi:hypothetical protein